MQHRPFVKLDKGLLDSSIWMQPHDVLRVWIALLAKSDAQGFVRVAVPALAHLCQVPIDRLEEILALLEAPDPHSRTPDNDGRRIERVPGGWVIVNHNLYRDNLAQPTPEAIRKRRQRERQTKRDMSRPVTPCHAASVTVRDCHTEEEEEEEEEEERVCASAPPSPPRATRGDPLASFPKLQTVFDRSCLRMKEQHPKVRLPKPGTPEWRKARSALAKLVTADGFTLDEVVQTLAWLFTGADEAADFWRAQVHSWPALRRARDGLTKFAKIHEARLRAAAKANGAKTGPPGAVVKDARYYLALQAQQQAAEQEAAANG